MCVACAIKALRVNITLWEPGVKEGMYSCVLGFKAWTLTRSQTQSQPTDLQGVIEHHVIVTCRWSLKRPSVATIQCDFTRSDCLHIFKLPLETLEAAAFCCGKSKSRTVFQPIYAAYVISPRIYRLSPILWWHNDSEVWAPMTTFGGLSNEWFSFVFYSHVLLFCLICLVTVLSSDDVTEKWSWDLCETSCQVLHALRHVCWRCYPSIIPSSGYI